MEIVMLQFSVICCCPDLANIGGILPRNPMGSPSAGSHPATISPMLEAYMQKAGVLHPTKEGQFSRDPIFLDKLLILKKGLGQGIPKQLVELK